MRAAGFIADPVQQVAAGAHLLDGRQVAAFVVDAGQPVADELFRDVGNAILAALIDLRRREHRPITHVVEDAARPVRHSSIEIAVLVAAVGPTG
jgi:hypothetical protein